MHRAVTREATHRPVDITKVHKCQKLGSISPISFSPVFAYRRGPRMAGRSGAHAIRCVAGPDASNAFTPTHHRDPGTATYSTRKVAVERALHATTPVTVLRPGAIHGPGSQPPREWWIVKRILDGRKAIPLAYRGTSRFHTTSVANIAAPTRVVIEAPANRVLNIADPSARGVANIAAVISQHMGYAGHSVEIWPPYPGDGRSVFEALQHPRPELLAPTGPSFTPRCRRAKDDAMLNHATGYTSACKPPFGAGAVARVVI